MGCNSESVHGDDSQSGVSGFALYVPRFRVDLERWCAWTGSPWDKVRATVGNSFRTLGPRENVYTMAANAVMRLLTQYQVDPQRVGFLGLATESSTDNSAGAVIVRGMVDQGLGRTGREPLRRSLEVPEFKHACLGGVYALKAALRYVQCDGRDRLAVVVAADIADYARGSTGEQTQGAGAVAMLVERHPKLLRFDLAHAGSASAYRGPDFRKPFARHFLPGYAQSTGRLKDFPVFSGKYSTMAYVDEVLHACEALPTHDYDYYQRMRAWFLHRPYRLMPLQAVSMLWVRSLTQSARHHSELQALCKAAGVDTDDVLREGRQHPDLYASLLRKTPPKDPYPATTAVAKALRQQEQFTDFVAQKMSWGSQTMADLGNLYSAALPAWIAAGMEDAGVRGVDLAGAPMMTVGYGSGDAAEAIPMSAVEGWQEAAGRIGAERALRGSVDLTQEQYEALHDGKPIADLDASPQGQFSIARIGSRYEKEFQDLGVEYYEYHP